LPRAAGRSASTRNTRLRFGILGAADIARTALIPAIEAAANAELVALASRDLERGRRLFAGTVYGDYQELLDDGAVEAVYLPLPNSLHREWAIRTLAAGKHVLCEKPLAVTAAEAREMAAAARDGGRLLMEAFMYRFHPRIRSIVAGLREHPPTELRVRFGFPLDAPGNYRLEPALGGGALLDVGCYTIDLARWILGEPEWVEATGHTAEVDMTVEMTLGFASGASAHLFASFETPETQGLIAGEVVVDKPFTAWKDPTDPYQVMVEEFSAAALAGLPAPLALEDSIANLRVVDAVRRSLDTGHRHHLAEAGESRPPAVE
jgi:D-xylose 1-dehydrogenase (NADP+, D-xylono-1,5-lactone-forming)